MTEFQAIVHSGIDAKMYGASKLEAEKSAAIKTGPIRPTRDEAESDGRRMKKQVREEHGTTACHIFIACK